MSHVLVTGASGFVGRALVNDLAASGYTVRAAMRHPADIFSRTVEVVAVSDLTRPVEWRPLLKGIDTVVHLAGTAHATGNGAEEVYDRVNRLATAELAAAARKAGIRRLIFASSIRAQSGSRADSVMTEAHEPRPTEAYGRSKLAAEEAVRASAVAFTIFRPVLVYGTEPKGNLAALLRLAQSRWPLPLGSLKNRRSLLARDNLIGAIHFALANATTANETYIVADPLPLSIADIVAALRVARGRRPGLIPVWPPLIAAPLKALGRADLWDRLGGELIASPAKLVGAGWRPSVVDTRAGLVAMAQAASPVKLGTASRSTR